MADSASEAPAPTEASEVVPSPASASGVYPLETPESNVKQSDFDVSLCTSCKKPVDETNSVVLIRNAEKAPQSRRCKCCHALKSRINRICAKHGNLAKDWTAVSDEEKKTFYKNFGNLVGEDLIARLQETITECKKTSSLVEFEGTGDFLDEIDLREKYKSKPDQLQNILANTRTYFCNVRQVWLYEDVCYKRRAKDSEEVSRAEKRKIQAIPRDQATEGESGEVAKKPKSKKGKGANEADTSQPKLKAGEKKKLLKKLEAMNTKRLTLMDWCCKARGEKLKELVPSYVIEAATKLIDEAVAFGNECENILACDHGNAKDLIDRLEELSEACNEATTRVKCQVEQAQGFLAETKDES